MKQYFLISVGIASTMFASASFSEKKHQLTSLNSKQRYIIGCDVNTSTVTIGLFRVEGEKPKLSLELTTKTKEIGSDFTNYFAQVMTHLEKKHGVKPILACISTPGVTGANRDYTKHDKLDFPVDGQAIMKVTSIKKIFVVNDFEVAGFGVLSIDPKNIVTLNAGEPRERGTKVIVGAGNGLGSSLMLWNEKLEMYMPSPLSYSFVEFSAQSELELLLEEYLQKEAGSRSWGKVLGASGGIKRIYAFLNNMQIDKVPYDSYLEVFAARKKDEIAQKAVALYMKLYARLIRNVAYAQQPHNGIYIVNSVAQHNPTLITDSAFIKEIMNTQNDYLLNYLSKIPMYFISSESLYLYGSALYALVYESTK